MQQSCSGPSVSSVPFEMAASPVGQITSSFRCTTDREEKGEEGNEGGCVSPQVKLHHLSCQPVETGRLKEKPKNMQAENKCTCFKALEDVIAL